MADRVIKAGVVGLGVGAVGILRQFEMSSTFELRDASVLQLRRFRVIAEALRALDLAAQCFLLLFQIARLLNELRPGGASGAGKRHLDLHVGFILRRRLEIDDVNQAQVDDVDE